MGASGDEAAERYVEAERLLSWHLSCALRRPWPAPDAPDGGGRPTTAPSCSPARPGRGTPWRWRP
uniref:hypothetical protein n=1 Tax=Streptomyces chryseus TaxID=68186 RepID=UPI0027E580C2|nr:hypothetical protein [Streptomyces chryseus]